MDADAVADEVLGRNWESGNNSGNNRSWQAPEAEAAPADVSTEAVESKSVT
jgi:hypothetical protein